MADQVVRARSLDWEDLGPLVEAAHRGVQQDLPGWTQCQARRRRHRAWVYGLVKGCRDLGADPLDHLLPLVHLSLLLSYDEGILLRVFAHTLGMGIGDAWVDAARDAEEWPKWCAAFEKGLAAGMETLEREYAPLRPELLDPLARILESGLKGMRAAAHR